MFLVTVRFNTILSYDGILFINKQAILFFMNFCKFK